MRARPLALFFLFAACNGDKATDDSAAVDDSGASSDDSGASTGDCADLVGTELCTSWLLNTTEEAAVIQTDGAVLVDVQSASAVDDGGDTYVEVKATGVPDYEVTLTQDQVDALTGRPMAYADFRDGTPLVAVGDTVEYGQDIGFDSIGCVGQEGYGYWPPGPACPEDVGHDLYFPAAVSESDQTCYTQPNANGLWVNGVALFNWDDAQTYQSQNVWHQLAAKFETYDVDICAGHAQQQGMYHHHSNPTCLGAELGDDGSGHSPIYGWAADGVPVYGPYVAAGELAESCWTTRDYSDASDPLGCGGSGDRSCVLLDPLHPDEGTEDASSDGPRVDSVQTTLSGNTVTVESGYYFEDWYYDADCTDGSLARLDEHNGHDHDGLGYHYHITSTFPYTIGPTFYGELRDNAVLSCSSSPYSQGGPPP